MKKIRDYVENLFVGTNETKKIKDLKEELIANLEEKYSDLIRNDEDEKEAYKIVINSIGDINELIDPIEKGSEKVIHYDEKSRKKRAFVISFSVLLYIISIIAVVVLEELGMEDYIVVSAFLSLSGFASVILIYHFVSTPNYKKIDDTLVEDFKAYRVKKQIKNEKNKAISSIIWMTTVIVYLIVSFTFQNWYISWVIFLIGVIVENIVKLLGDKNE